MGISSPGIGSGINVDAIIQKLMAVETAPRDQLDKKAAANQDKLSALGKLSGAVSAFQGSLSGLTSPSSFQSVTGTSTNTDVLVASATSTAQTGTYKINVTQAAQAQTLAAAGQVSKKATIGAGASTTISFELGAVSGGSFGVAGGALAAGVAASGITPGALTINGTVIGTDAGTKTARLLADAINAKSATTGVSATESSATLPIASFGNIDTNSGATYELKVGGVTIASQTGATNAGAGLDAAGIDAILGGGAASSATVASALSAAGITFTGTAAAGTLSFTSLSGATFSLDETVTGGVVMGGIGTTNTGPPLPNNASSSTLFGSAGASTFGVVDTSGGGTYALQVGGVTIASQAAGVAAGAGLTAAGLDAILVAGTDPTSAAVAGALATAGITVHGSATAGDLHFTNASGAAFSLDEIVGGVAGGVQGGIGGAATNNGSSVTVAAVPGPSAANGGSSASATASGSIALVSANASPITIGGTAPAAAGLSAGIGGAYIGASFAQDATKSSGSVVIDSTNNTLEGIRDAINKAGFGVNASIVGDGSAAPYHLVLSSSATGASASMKISLSGTSVNGVVGAPDPALVGLLAYDPAGTQTLSQNSSAQSTKLSVNGIQVTSETTSVSDAIDGVTLTIGAPGQASLMVARDTSTLTTSVNGFVKAYNDLNSQIKTLTGYNADTKVGGPLLGDSTAQSLQAAVRRQMSQSIPGLSGSLTSLTQIGIGFQKDGSLALDSAKLTKAITNNFSDIGGLFAAIGKSSDALVSFTSATAATKAGEYAIDITALATQGTLQGGTALPALTTIAADTSWTVTLNDPTPSNGASTAIVPIRAGSYTPANLATMLQSAINGASLFSGAGSSVVVSIETDVTKVPGSLKVVSSRYGSASNIAIGDGGGSTSTPVSDVFFGAAPTAGIDVAGTIGGLAASGSGQSLTGSAGGPVEGLKLAITGDTIGNRGTLSFSQGYAYQLNNLMSGFLGSKGIITARTTGINSTLKDIAKATDTFNTHLAEIEKRYRAQYTALDTTIASMNTTTSYLTQQLASIAANK